VGTGIIRECTNKDMGKNFEERMEKYTSTKQTEKWKNGEGGEMF
jgi:hypothetical protein